MSAPRALVRAGAGVLVTLAAILLSARGASAFGGFYVNSSDSKPSSSASQVVIMREGTRTVLSMQNDYQGPPASFAMVVPVPVVIQKDNVKTLPRELFARIDMLDAPRLVETWEADPCASRAPPKGGGRSSSLPVAPESSAPAAAKAKDTGVTIEAQFTVGEYDVVVLGAKDSAGLDAWLRREGYKMAEGSERLLRPYVQSRSKFFVAKVDVTKVKMTGGKATLSPLRFHYDAAELVLPVRLGLMSSAPTQDLIIHVLGKGKRYEVATHPSVTIPTNLDVAEVAKERFSSFYAALFDRTLAKTPGGVVTEYAWDAGSCDPCTTAPLTDAELVTLGGDVMPSVSSESDLLERDLLKALGADAAPTSSSRFAAAPGPGPRRTYYGLRSPFVLTRLHARYTRDTLGEDLVLREAPPLRGGRERRSGPGPALETTVSVGADERDADPSNAFQARYVVRHPWTGPIACDAPVRDVWGGPPNGLDNGGPRPALGLADAPRDNVQLASFLRTDVAALDLKAAGALPSGVGTFSVPSAAPPSGADASSADGGVSGGGAAPDVKKSGCAGCTTTSSSSSSPAPASLGALIVGLVIGWRRRSPARSRASRALFAGR